MHTRTLSHTCAQARTLSHTHTRSLCVNSRECAGINLASAVADEGRETQVSKDWRLWWCPIIKTEWANDRNLQLSLEAKEATEMLRNQVFTHRFEEGIEYTLDEFYGENETKAMPNMQGEGKRHCFW